ncbi:hypothetical protein FB451DRAFT_1391441 [Mycena latifolia]|nr:hypothetical protein FB451DRAFT_1391441 [Mycena latifolia]
MENDALRPPHSHSTSEDTRAALRALELAAVERDAQIARLVVQLQHAREDTECARAEASEARAEANEAQGRLKEAQVELPALRTKYDRAKGWWAVNHKRKNDLESAADGGAREDSSPSRSPKETCVGALPDSSPDPSRSPVVLTTPLQSQARAHGSDRDPRKRIKLDSTAAAPVSRSTGGASARASAPAANPAPVNCGLDPRSDAPRPMPLPSHPNPTSTSTSTPATNPANPTPNCGSVRLPSLLFRRIPRTGRYLHPRTDTGPTLECPAPDAPPLAPQDAFHSDSGGGQFAGRECTGSGGGAGGRGHVAARGLCAHTDPDAADADADAAIPIPAVPAGLRPDAHTGRVPAAAPESASATNPKCAPGVPQYERGGPAPNFPNTSPNPGANTNWSPNPNARWSPNPNVRDKAGGNRTGNAPRSASWNENGGAQQSPNPNASASAQRSANSHWSPNPNTNTGASWSSNAQWSPNASDNGWPHR